MHGAPSGLYEEQLLKWLVNYLPTFYAAGAALSISALMSIYDGQSLIRTATGSLACGILTLAVSGSLEFFGLPGSAVTIIGASIGFMGAEKLRDKVGGLFCRRQKGTEDGE